MRHVRIMLFSLGCGFVISGLINFSVPNAMSAAFVAVGSVLLWTSLR